jgi:hypothetical protein
VSDTNCQEKTRSETQHPEGAARAASHVVACAGAGRFFRIEVAPGRRFIAFHYHDVGKKGGVERIAGQRPDRTWATAGW